MLALGTTPMMLRIICACKSPMKSFGGTESLIKFVEDGFVCEGSTCLEHEEAWMSTF
jgi:hypothetical protein